MLQTVLPLILKLSLFLMTAVATHLVMSFGQTLLHYKVGHHPISGKLFRIADLQEHWEKNGMSALDEVRQKFPDRYVDNCVMLSRVIRLEADVKHSLAKPKTVEEALAELESKVGDKGRRKFEKFLREVAKDEDGDVFDVELK